MPEPTTAVVAGTSLLSGFMGADAAGDAAKAQEEAAGRAAQAELEGTRLTIEEMRRQYDQARADYQPYMQTGLTGLQAYEDLLLGPYTQGPSMDVYQPQAPPPPSPPPPQQALPTTGLAQPTGLPRGDRGFTGLGGDTVSNYTPTFGPGGSPIYTPPGHANQLAQSPQAPPPQAPPPQASSPSGVQNTFRISGHTAGSPDTIVRNGLVYQKWAKDPGGTDYVEYTLKPGQDTRRAKIPAGPEGTALQKGPFTYPKEPIAPAFTHGREGEYTPFTYQQEGEYTPFTHGEEPIYGDFDFNVNQLYQSPGYQFRLGEGEKGVERSLAAGGRRLSGRGLKELQRYTQGLASTEYGNEWQRQFSDYVNRQNYLSDRFAREYGRRFGEHQFATQEEADRFAREYGRRFGEHAFSTQAEADQFQREYARRLAEHTDYRDYLSGQFGREYGRRMGEYSDYRNRLAGLAGVGQQATGAVTQAGQSAASGIGGALGGGYGGAAQAYLSGGAAKAGGYLGQADAWRQAAGNIGNYVVGQNMLGAYGNMP